MSIAATCPHCGHSNSVPERFAGQRGRCSQCGDVFEIATGTPPPTPVATTTAPVKQPALKDIESPPTTSSHLRHQRAKLSSNSVVYLLLACGVVLGVGLLIIVATTFATAETEVVDVAPNALRQNPAVTPTPTRKESEELKKPEPVSRQERSSWVSSAKPSKGEASVAEDLTKVDPDALEEDAARKQLARSIGADPTVDAGDKPDEPYRLTKRRPVEGRPDVPAVAGVARPAPADRFAGLPDPTCEVCRGRGMVPLDPPTQFVFYDELGDRDPKALAGCRHCPKCQADKDAELLNREALARLPFIDQRHKYWQEVAARPIIRAQTPRITIFSQLSATETRRVAQSIAKATAHLESITRSLDLVQNNPDDCELVILATRNDYLRVIDKFEESGEFGGRDWTLARQLSGFTQNSNLSVSFKASVPAPQHAVNSAGMLLINRSTNYKGGDWLRVGFSAYLEYTIFKMNAVTWADYELTDFNIDNNWRLALRQLLTQRRIRPWDEMSSMQLRNYGAAEHISAFGMVRFLIETDRKGFLDFIQAISEGTETQAALESGYGVDLPTLEKRWTNWISRGR